MIINLFIWWFKFKGWKINEHIPKHVAKCVVIAAPHTSNWDFVYTLAVCKMVGIKMRYLIKKELFFWPLSIFFTATGGISVERKQKQNMVDTYVDIFNAADEMILLIPAEGTRARVEKWKSGFYHIAIKANIPVMMGYLDYKKKEAGFGEALYMTDSVENDLSIIKAFYKDKVGKHPQDFNIDAIKFE